MKKALVHLSDKNEKKLEKLPKHIQLEFYKWAKLIADEGLPEMQKTPAFRDHALKGKLTGLRSSSLNRSYRIIYKTEEQDLIIVIVIEVNKHDYKI